MRVLTSTQVGVSLSLAVVTRTNGNTQLNFSHLIDLTGLVFWLLVASQRLDLEVTSLARFLARVMYWLAEPIELSRFIGFFNYYFILYSLAKNLVINLAINPISVIFQSLRKDF